MYSTHGRSTAGFSPHEAAMYANEILSHRWQRAERYLSFIDDLLLHSEARRLPLYIAPFALRALHPETATARCGRLSSEVLDMIENFAKQAEAVFKPFLDREHAPWAWKD